MMVKIKIKMNSAVDSVLSTKTVQYPQILFELGCQHKHTETGGAWSVAHKLPLLSTTRPTERLNGGWCCR